MTLHDDAIAVDSSARIEARVSFEPFVGVAPRKYLEFFSKVDREAEDGSPKEWNPAIAEPRYPEPGLALAYPDAEEIALLDLKPRLESANLLTGDQLATLLRVK